MRRNDWLATLFEEVTGALLWFNPGIWPALAEARLAREQLVDEETVRLTDAGEPYVQALLAIARHRPMPDLAPAPLFLRRRHLTQRMHQLLLEAPISRARVAFSYSSIAASLLAVGWFAAAAVPFTGRPLAPVVQPKPQRPVSVPMVDPEPRARQRGPSSKRPVPRRRP